MLFWNHSLLTNLYVAGNDCCYAAVVYIRPSQSVDFQDQTLFRSKGCLYNPWKYYPQLSAFQCCSCRGLADYHELWLGTSWLFISVHSVFVLHLATSPALKASSCLIKQTLKNTFFLLALGPIITFKNALYVILIASWHIIYLTLCMRNVLFMLLISKWQFLKPINCHE